MKVLFDHHLPFALAHGGLQIQIEQTIAAVEGRGVEVEKVRWWDQKQTGEIIHYFGRPSGSYIDFAHAKGMKVVVSELLTAMGSRSAQARLMQKAIMRLAKTALPESFLGKLGWETYRRADAFVANTRWEAHLMQDMFGADPAKVHVIPNGVEEVFFHPSPDSPRRSENYLVCTAVIHPRKRVLELARAAVRAKVPVWIIGKPYSETDPYYREFLEVQQRNPDLIQYRGGISDRKELAGIYQRARGFVLLSTMETLSLSSFEAAASKCPLLLSDLPWARTTFGDDAVYAKGSVLPETLAPILRDFYERAPTCKMSFQPLRWGPVGDLFKAVYSKVLL